MSHLLRLLLIGALCVAGATCRGAALEVSPVRHDMAVGRQTLGMTVANRGAIATTVQVRAFNWTHDHEGRDTLTPATEVLVSPAIFSLEAGRSQTVRALFGDGATETSPNYRLLIDEIPATSAAEPVRFALRLSVPVFRQAAVPAPASLSWRLEGRRAKLVAVNAGATHERLRDLQLVSAQGAAARPTSPWGPYLLGGHSRHWSVDAGVLNPGDRWTLTALTDVGRIEVPLVVAP
ncbi:MAG: fimbria/pilus periplasmic chaperone [Pseudomonadota bacterium]